MVNFLKIAAVQLLWLSNVSVDYALVSCIGVFSVNIILLW